MAFSQSAHERYRKDAAAKPGSGTNDGAQKAENEPVLTEQQAGTNPKNIGGEGASKVSGPESVATKDR